MADSESKSEGQSDGAAMDPSNRAAMDQSEDHLEIVFYVHYNFYGDKTVNLYPNHITKLLEPKFQELCTSNNIRSPDEINNFYHMKYNPRLKPARRIIYQDCTIFVPNFYNAGFNWFTMYEECNPHIKKLQLCQLTANGGLRFAYRVEVTNDSDTYTCPVTNNKIPVPLFIKNPEEHKQKLHVFWSDTGVVQGNKLSQFRKIDNNSWIPYNNAISKLIITAFNENKNSIRITLGVIKMRIIFRYQGLPIGTGVQKIKHRLHFIKVISVTDTEYEAMCKSLIHQNETILSTAIGDTDTCCICTENLHGPCKVIKLPCGHAIHGICIQSWASSNGPTCPVCRVRTDQGGCDGSQHIHGRR